MWADSSDRTRRSTPLNPDFVGEDIRDLPDKRHQAVTDGLWQVKPALAGSRPLAGRSTGAWATTRSIPGLARALGNDNSKWPHCAALIWPHPRRLVALDGVRPGPVAGGLAPLASGWSCGGPFPGSHECGRPAQQRGEGHDDHAERLRCAAIWIAPLPTTGPTPGQGHPKILSNSREASSGPSPDREPPGRGA